MSVRLRLLDAARALAFNKTVPESPEKEALQEACRDAEAQYWDNDAEEEEGELEAG